MFDYNNNTPAILCQHYKFLWLRYKCPSRALEVSSPFLTSITPTPQRSSGQVAQRHFLFFFLELSMSSRPATRSLTKGANAKGNKAQPPATAGNKRGGGECQEMDFSKLFTLSFRTISFLFPSCLHTTNPLFIRLTLFLKSLPPLA